ncbi:MAG: restriction endonuclease subunit S [Deltaproteobacteria bacterium]|nr:restriction endonuclease subunit S [Deltaproteobacteria bacterium]
MNEIHTSFRGMHWDGDIPWVTPTDLGELDGHTLTISQRRITKAGLASCSAQMVPPGTVLMSSRAPIGHLAVANVACCTNQGCKNLIPTESLDTWYLFFALKMSVPELKALGSGATFTEISKTAVESFQIPLPPLSEQKRIAAILNEQMAAVERARAATEAQLEAAKALPAAYLRGVFNSPEAKSWPRMKLGEVCDLLPAKSIATVGDAEVLAITTACLTETGFQPSGVKAAKMWAVDAAECVVSPGEILIARSNTPDLVGRVAMFSGEPKGAVASDLTIRIRPKDDLNPSFVTAYLSFLYLTGYWKDRAGGASGSMKKITRSQILDEQVPIPPVSEQTQIVARLSEQMAAAERTRKALERQLDTINKLPAALLRRAFNGGL